jgi:putative ABC transport system permease protein
MRLWDVSGREFRRRPGRTLLTLLGVALGLTALVATRLSLDSVRQAYRDLFAPDRAALKVRASDLGGFSSNVVSPLASVPGVRAVVPEVEGVAAVSGDGGNVPVMVLGVEMRDLPLVSGADGIDDDTVLIDPALADSLRLAPGGPVEAWGPGGRVRIDRVRRLGPRPDAPPGRLIISLARAQQLFALPGRINGLRLVLADGADAGRVRRDTERLLPAGLSVESPDVRSEVGAETLATAEGALRALGWVALATAALVVLNTFLLSAGERRRQLAVLRCLGATRARVAWLLLREMALLGAVGSLVGCALGAGLALLLLTAVGRFLGIGLPGLRPSAEPFGLAALLGLGAPLIATALPAWRAASRPPLAELNAVPPAVAAPRGLAVPLRIGVSVALAAGQLLRHPVRTALAVSLLSVALASAVCFSQTADALRADLGRWCRRTVVADFLVYGSVPDTGFVMATALPDQVGADLGAVEGVESVGRIAFLPAHGEGRPVLVLARTFPPAGPLPLDLREGDEGTVRRGLERGGVVLGTGLAARLGRHAGDTFTLTTPRGPAVLPVVGTATEYAAGGSALYLEWSCASRLLPLTGANVFLVSARRGASAAAEEKLRRCCADRHLVLKSNAELRALVDRSAARVTGALAALAMLVIAIAALGIANTLMMNVQDQARQFGLLRALGLTRRQLFRTVLVQALLLGGASLFPGTAVGLLTTFLVRGTGAAPLPSGLHVSGGLTACCCVLAVAVALAASIVPARRVSRLPVTRLLEAR